MLVTDHDADNDCSRISTWVILPSTPGISRSGEEKEPPRVAEVIQWKQSSFALSKPSLE